MHRHYGLRAIIIVCLTGVVVHAVSIHTERRMNVERVRVAVTELRAVRNIFSVASEGRK